MTGSGTAAAKQTPLERRKGESALSDFADYVEKQQAHRVAHARTAGGDSAYASASVSGASTEEHAELDILDSLDLVDSVERIRLKDLLLSKPPDGDAEDDASLAQLGDVLSARIEEGNGETLFELGTENNGESMGFSREEWDVALGRLKEAAKRLNADCRVLLTTGVGGEEEGESTKQEGGEKKEKEKDKGGASGKVMIRRRPDTVEDVIETRIAVVGNGPSL